MGGGGGGAERMRERGGERERERERQTDRQTDRQRRLRKVPSIIYPTSIQQKSVESIRISFHLLFHSVTHNSPFDTRTDTVKALSN